MVFSVIEPMLSSELGTTMDPYLDMDMGKGTRYRGIKQKDHSIKRIDALKNLSSLSRKFHTV